MAEEKNDVQILSGPDSYVTMSKPIASVLVQEADLKRLNDHLNSVSELKLTIDFFTLFLGACVSAVLSFFIEWVKTGTAPIIYLGIAFLALFLSFGSYLKQSRNLSLEKSQHLLDEAKKDLKTIYEKANISN